MPQRTEPRRLVTEDDIHSAIAWCLDGLDPVELKKLAPQVGGLSELRGGEDDPEVSALLERIEHHFDHYCDPWTILCALAARASADSDRHEVFWPAGMVVIDAANNRNQDALSDLIWAFLRNQPGSAAVEIWRHFGDVAKIYSDVLADFDSEANLLSFIPNPAHQERWETIGFEAFARRVRRIRADMKSNHVRKVA